MNHGWIYRERVKSADAEQTILEYYTNKYRHSSPLEWTTRINSGQILLNQQLTEISTILKPQDKLAYHRQPWVEPQVPLEFEVVYQDSELMVVNKPSGLPVLPGGGFLSHTLLWQLKKHYPQDTPIPIHRLGRGTSGLLLLARSPLAKSDLTQQLRNSTIGQSNNKFNKVYRVLVSGKPTRDRFRITQPIGKIPHPVLGYIYGTTSTGKHAHSDCQVIEHYQNCSLLEVKIATGRPHQIRIHLASVGYPLLGDPLYIAGGGFAKISPHQQSIPVPGDCGYFLHAHRLSFTHPQTLRLISFESSTPQSWILVSNNT
jgi:23S rRNA pseudouridine1911/1915/1917 synthase